MPRSAPPTHPPNRPPDRPAEPLTITLEISRADDIADPYAMPDRPQAYFLRRPDGGYAESRLRWTGRVERLLDAVRVGDDPEARQQIGRLLRGFLDDFDWAVSEALIERAIAAGRPVHIELRSAAAELWRLPWSLTTFGPAETHLGGLPGVLIRCAWPETRTTPRARPSARPERVLVAWAAPSRPVPWAAHVDAIARAVAGAPVAADEPDGALDFDESRDVVADASIPALLEALRAAEPERPIAALHLLCHGAATGDGFGLAFVGSGGGAAVDAGQLRTHLGPFSDRVRVVVLAACDGGNAGPAGATLGSVAQGLHRAGFAAVIASAYPLSGAASVTFAQAFYGALLTTPTSVERAFEHARRRVAEAHPERAEWSGLQLWSRGEDGADARPITLRPYRGLLPFEAVHAPFFFGRTAERAEVQHDLAQLIELGRPRLLAIAAASGTGKSSLMRAGVLPDLRRRWPDARVAIIKPGAAPLAHLDDALARWAAEADGGAGGGQRVLLVDQFEELFTQSRADDARAFARRLWRLAGDPGEPIVVLITVRVDFIGRCGELQVEEGLNLDTVFYDERHRVFVPRMAPAGLREAIEGPAMRAGLMLDAGLVDRILDDSGAEPGALPLMQHALDRLWHRRTGRRLTHAAYDAIEGVSGALMAHAEQTLDDMEPTVRAAARRLLIELVSIGEDLAHATRRRVRLRDLMPSDAARAAATERAIAGLEASRLVSRAPAAAGAEVEIAHEALIRRWPRLAEWVEADRERLVQTRAVLATVEDHRQHGALLRGSQLGHAVETLRRYPDGLPADARAWVERSARSARLRSGGLLAVALTVAAIMGALAWYGLSEAKRADDRAEAAEAATHEAKVAQAEAEEERRAAVVARRRSKDASLVRLAGRLRTESPELAAAALREVHDPLTTPGAMQGLLDLARHPIPLTALDFGTDGVASALFSPDGAWVVADAQGQGVAIARTDGRGPVSVVPGARPIVCAGSRHLAVQHDGRGVVTSTLHRLPIDGPGQTLDARVVGCDPSGRVWALQRWVGDEAFARREVVVLRDVEGGETQLPLERFVAFLPGGRIAGLAIDDPSAGTATLAVGPLEAPLDGLRLPSSTMHIATVDPTGRWLASHAWEDGLRWWSLAAPAGAGRRADLRGVEALAFSSEHLLVGRSTPGRAMAWTAVELAPEAGRPPSVAPPVEVDGPLLFSPDRATIILPGDTPRRWTPGHTLGRSRPPRRSPGAASSAAAPIGSSCRARGAPASGARTRAGGWRTRIRPGRTRRIRSRASPPTSGGC